MDNIFNNIPINIPTLILLIIVFLSSQSGHYSTINFFLLWYIKFIKKYKWYPFIICNTFGVALTWYSAVFLDRTIPYRMMKKNNWSLFKFISGDIMLHIISLLMCKYMLRDYSSFYMEPKNYEIIKHCGFYSLFTNMLWSLLYQQGFELNQRYVPLPTWKWNTVWSINVLAHLLPMFYMNSTN